VEYLYRGYIYHILIKKNYSSILIAVTIAWLGIIIYNALFFLNSDSILSIVCIVFEAITLLYSGCLAITSFTSLYERFHWQLHLSWAFMLTGESILTAFRDLENYNLKNIEPVDYTVR
jgi:hypothetical protein